MCERLVGIKQINRGTDPRHEGPREPIAAAWKIFFDRLLALDGDDARAAIRSSARGSIDYGVNRGLCHAEERRTEVDSRDSNVRGSNPHWYAHRSDWAYVAQVALNPCR